MLSTPRGQFAIIVLLVLNLVIGYGLNQTQPENPLPTISSYSLPYHGQLLEPKPMWGEPPEYDGLKEHPTEKDTRGFKLPEYEGWYRSGDSNSIAAGQNVAVCFYKERYHCLELQTGEERWSNPAPKYTWNPIIIISPEVVAAFERNKLDVYRLDSGELIWDSIGEIPIAWGDGILWVLHNSSTDTFKYLPLDEVRALNAETGKTLCSFSLSSLNGYSSLNSIIWESPEGYCSNGAEAGVFPEGDKGTEKVAVKDGRRIKVLFSNGKVDEFAAALSIWPASFSFTDKGLFVIEYETSKATGVSDRAMNAFTDRNYSQMVARLIDLTSKKELWRFTDKISFDFDNGRSYIDCFACTTKDKAIIRLPSITLILNLKTGAILSEIPCQAESYKPAFSVGSSGNYFVAADDGIDSPLRAFNLLTNRGEPAYALGSYGGSLAIAQDTLLVSTMTRPGGVKELGSSDHFFAVKLDENGRPIPGKMLAYSLPQSWAKLVEDFYSSPDPIEDGEIMSQAVAGGQDSLKALTERGDRAKPVQLDALVALTAYIEGSRSVTTSSDIFIHYIKSADKSRLAARIPLWIEDKSLKDIKRPLLGLLAQCGGGAAKAYLDKVYQPAQASKFQTPSPKYSIPDGITSALAKDLDDSSYRPWGFYADGKGTRYFAYIDSGLLSDCFVCVGIDSNSDNVFEEVLPTGLVDRYSRYNREYQSVKNKKPIRISVNNDTVLISYYAPVDKIEHYYGVDIPYISDKYATAKLSLNELRVDSDSDGLTDIWESLLLLNPHSQDTDSDGINDAEDQWPNVNEAKMGRVERGVQRALKYCENLVPLNVPDATNGTAGSPLETNYYKFKGCSGLTAVCGKDSRCISLSSEDETKAYEKLVHGAYWDLQATVNVYSVPDWRKSFTGDDTERTTMEVLSFDRELPPGTEYVITLERFSSNAMVTLCSVEGELYPSSAHIELTLD